MPNIRHSISITASPDRVFPLVSSGRGFSQWWAADVSEVGKDGILDLGFFNRSTLYRLQPKRIVAPAEAEWLCLSGKEWDATRISFKLAPSNAGTLLQFVHADWRSETDYFISCNTTWGELMFCLKSAAEGKTPGPLFSASGLAY
ncbi:MAG TPA: hypothetical protein VEU31_06165 [Candidatus Acidoferrales bacterium]|nr:hypothetical protein [Candidatus Acidoferrales bacterium]